MSDIDKLLEQESAAVELAERESKADEPLPESTQVTRGLARSKTLQVRLTEVEYEVIEELARDAGLPSSTFARQILLQALPEQREAEGDGAALEAAVDRLERDVTALRRRLSLA